MMPTQTYSGKKVVIWFLVGAVVFTIIGMAGTWMIGQATTPFFRKMQQDRERAAGTKNQRLDVPSTPR
ncbi:MAG: hypothetical protein ACOYON_01110 [Fimbriimonas sp.]